MRASRAVRTTSRGLVLLLAGAGLAACGGDADAADDATVVVWNLDSQPDRIAGAEAIDAEFTRATGIQVEQVPITESQLPSLVVSAAVSGTMPDLVSGLSLGYVRQLGDQGLLDTEAAARVVEALDPSTFTASALELTRDGDAQLAVPSDSWSQILVYRTDLFAEAGLEPPTTYAAIEAAAQALTEAGRSGITLASDPADPFTSQTFESLALGNGCQLVDTSGAVGLTSPECVEAFRLYSELTGYAPQGTQTVDSTRATYFAGQAAMTIWSTYLLDELAGLRSDALPTCEECRQDPRWLAENTGVVTAVSGPDGDEPVGFAEIASFALLTDGETGSTPQTEAYVEHVMSDAYLDWVGVAPEGRYPVRTGDAQDPERFTSAWLDLPAGIEPRVPLVEVYGPEVVEQVTSATQTLQRWAIPQGQGALLGPVSAELPVPRALSGLANGSTTPEETAQEAADAVEEIARSQQ